LTQLIKQIRISQQNKYKNQATKQIQL